MGDRYAPYILHAPRELFNIKQVDEWSLNSQAHGEATLRLVVQAVVDQLLDFRIL